MRVQYLALALSTVSILYAQTGLRGGTDGMRQISAQSLGKGEVLFGLGGEAVSGYGMLPSGGYTTTYQDGYAEQRSVDARRPVSMTGYVNLVTGLTSFWDLGASMPFYYDQLRPTEGNTRAMTDAWGAGQGDLQLHTKMRLPIAADYPFQMALIGIAQTPTGKKGTGFYPRNMMVVAKNGQDNTDPYTTGGFVAGGGLALTLDLASEGIPLRFNGYGIYQHPFEKGHEDVGMWGLGLDQRSWEYATSFVEVSGEHRRSVLRREMNPMCDRLMASAGLRFHMPYGWDLGLAADVSPIDKGNVVVTQTNSEGSTRYTTGAPNFGASALLVYNSGRKSLDHDKDGVPDAQDRCPGTDARAQVDAYGCPLDQDFDGVSDYLDKCPNTLKGIVVLADGCPMDSDNDGISDFLDLCPATPAKMPVDAKGCPQDTDKDGIPDPLDKCPSTPKGMPIDVNGCPADADKDGVADPLDKCPGTRLGTVVDSKGCAADADNDGIADIQDKCPGTLPGVAVDTTGCPRDSDKDGVPDQRDQCPGTLVGQTVDSTGCPRDIDNDGVRNEFDKCPNTPQGLPVNQDGCPADTDHDGVADHLDKCPGTPQGATIDTLGCPRDSDNDGVPDHLDKCPRTLKGIEIDASGCPLHKEQDLTQLQRAINFKSGSAELTKNSYPTLDLVVALLKAIPSAKLEIQGHTDNTGSQEKNRKLSQERAVAVGLYFVSQGIEKSRLRPVGYGPDMPVQSNATKAGRDANRRVELVPFD